MVHVISGFFGAVTQDGCFWTEFGGVSIIFAAEFFLAKGSYTQKDL